MANALQVLSGQGPYEVQLSVGRFPFDFDLYDYAKIQSGG